MSILLFQKEIEAVINKHSMESGSATPDFILAEYLAGCLQTFNATMSKREKWYGRQVGAGPIVGGDDASTSR